jgi:NAD(P)-dependent dehydrogenase (short-subunit alcohol dehydrogenase family)
MTDTTWSLTGKRVVVVGGSSGIGFAVALLAKELGADVVIASSTRAKVDEALNRLPGAIGDLVDLKQEASIVDFLSRVGMFDHLVISGGDYDKRVFAATDDLDLVFARDAFESRVFGSLTFIKHGRHRITTGGSITLTSGMLANRPRKGSPLPTVVAGAVEQLVRGFAIDLAPLRINGVCPGLTLTELIVPQGMEKVKAATASLPIPRAASAAEVAQAYIYLMLNGYVTGQILTVDGGGMLV